MPYGNSKIYYSLEIGNVVDLLLHTKTDEIIKDFNRQTGDGKEDPVIHFYEEFLTAYDKSQKVQRGVYYTPQPVVNFIVRAVDEIIKNEFGYEDGLATTDTKIIKIKRDSRKRIDGFIRKVEDTEEVPAIQVLDPATGTGTFLRQIIIQIYHNFLEKYQNRSKREVQTLWNKYVNDSLLPRINGFELMMAPYAVAHMKLAMVLKDTRYDFSGDNRLNVFLTNSLEEAGNSSDQITLFEDALALESVEANRAKKNNGKVVRTIEDSIGAKLSDESSERTFTGLELIQYIYAILHSNKYRKQYNDQLKYDFPTVSYPESLSYFRRMATYGEKLFELHLPKEYYRKESPILLDRLVSYKFENDKIVLNGEIIVDAIPNIGKKQMGGYKPADKWLKDRKGMAFTEYDLELYKKIVSAIIKTDEIMQEIDQIIII